MFYTTEYTREYSKLEYILPSFPSRVLGLNINFEFFRASTRRLFKLRVISSRVFSSKVPTLIGTSTTSTYFISNEQKYIYYGQK